MRELEVAAREGRCEDEGWRVRKDGSRFWAQVIITALRDERGALVGFGKVARDLTERRRAEEERLETVVKASRVLEGMGELSVGLAKARTVSEVGTVVADRATLDTCFVSLLDESGAALELVGHDGSFHDLRDGRCGWKLACNEAVGDLAIRDGTDGVARPVADRKELDARIHASAWPLQ